MLEQQTVILQANAMSLDNSALSTFFQCQLKHYLRYQRHLASPDARPARDIGTLVHSFWSDHLHNADTQPGIAAALEALASMPDSKWRNSTDYAACYLAAINALSRAYEVAPQGVIFCNGAPRWQLRYSEVGFSMPLQAMPAARSDESTESDVSRAKRVFTGRVDAIVEDGNQQLWLLELKTSGSASQSNWRDMKSLATQTIGYCYAATQQFAKPIAGAIIIPVATSKNSAKLTPEIIIRYTDDDLMQWHNDTLAAFDMIQSCAEHSAWLPTGRYNSTCAGIDFGKCDYFDYCRSGYNEDVLTQLTVVNQWSPLVG